MSIPPQTDQAQNKRKFNPSDENAPRMEAKRSRTDEDERNAFINGRLALRERLLIEQKRLHDEFQHLNSERPYLEYYLPEITAMTEEKKKDGESPAKPAESHVPKFISPLQELAFKAHNFADVSELQRERTEYNRKITNFMQNCGVLKPNAREPKRANSKWDVLLIEMKAMAVDFRQELQWKREMGNSLTQFAIKYAAQRVRNAAAQQAAENENMRQKNAHKVCQIIREYWEEIRMESRVKQRLKSELSAVKRKNFEKKLILRSDISEFYHTEKRNFQSFAVRNEILNPEIPEWKFRNPTISSLVSTKKSPPTVKTLLAGKSPLLANYSPEIIRNILSETDDSAVLFVISSEIQANYCNFLDSVDHPYQVYSGSGRERTKLRRSIQKSKTKSVVLCTEADFIEDSEKFQVAWDVILFDIGIARNRNLNALFGALAGEGFSTPMRCVIENNVFSRNCIDLYLMCRLMFPEQFADFSVLYGSFANRIGDCSQVLLRVLKDFYVEAETHCGFCSLKRVECELDLLQRTRMAESTSDFDSLWSVCSSGNERAFRCRNVSSDVEFECIISEYDFHRFKCVEETRSNGIVEEFSQKNHNFEKFYFKDFEKIRSDSSLLHSEKCVEFELPHIRTRVQYKNEPFTDADISELGASPAMRIEEPAEYTSGKISALLEVLREHGDVRRLVLCTSFDVLHTVQHMLRMNDIPTFVLSECEEFNSSECGVLLSQVSSLLGYVIDVGLVIVYEIDWPLLFSHTANLGAVTRAVDVPWIHIVGKDSVESDVAETSVARHGVQLDLTESLDNFSICEERISEYAVTLHTTKLYSHRILHENGVQVTNIDLAVLSSRTESEIAYRLSEKQRLLEHLRKLHNIELTDFFYSSSVNTAPGWADAAHNYAYQRSLVFDKSVMPVGFSETTAIPEFVPQLRVPFVGEDFGLFSTPEDLARLILVRKKKKVKPVRKGKPKKKQAFRIKINRKSLPQEIQDKFPPVKKSKKKGRTSTSGRTDKSGRKPLLSEGARNNSHLPYLKDFKDKILYTHREDMLIKSSVSRFGNNWALIAHIVNSDPCCQGRLRSANDCFKRFQTLVRASSSDVTTVGNDTRSMSGSVKVLEKFETAMNQVITLRSSCKKGISHYVGAGLTVEGRVHAIHESHEIARGEVMALTGLPELKILSPHEVIRVRHMRENGYSRVCFTAHTS